MQSSPQNWITSSQALVIAITGLIGSIPPLIASIPALVQAFRKSTPSDASDQHTTKSKRTWLRSPAVLGFSLLAGAVFLLGARFFTQATLPINAKLANRAWEALVKNNYEGALQRASDCLDQFGVQAEGEQAKLVAVGTPPPPIGKVPEPEKSRVLERGVLNDVGACLFVKARAAEKMGKTDEARSAYQELSKLTYARVYDPAGFFWSPAEAASARLKR